jgi:hypothetical protein
MQSCVTDISDFRIFIRFLRKELQISLVVRMSVTLFVIDCKAFPGFLP